MCGRLLTTDPAELVEGWSDTRIVPTLADLARMKSYNVAPTRDVLVLRQREAGREIAALRWGLVPSWAKDESVGRRMFNARSESLADKPSFRAAFRKRRCVVLADGFYEWKKTPTGQVPYRVATGSVMMFPGVWETWRGPDGEVLESTAIVTRDARPPVASLHDREPVMFRTREQAYAWIDARRSDATELLAMLRGEGPRVELHEANPVLNRVGADGPSCLVPPSG